MHKRSGVPHWPPREGYPQDNSATTIGHVNQLTPGPYVVYSDPSNRHPQDNSAKTTGDVEKFVCGKKFQEFFSGVTVGGLKYVVLSGALWLRRAIWLMLVLGGLGFMIYQVYDRITYFLGNPRTVTVSVKTMDELDFPTVTICNENLVDKTKTESNENVGKLLAQMDQPWPVERQNEPNFTTVDIPAIEEFLQANQSIEGWENIWRWASPFQDRKTWQFCRYKNLDCNETLQLVLTEMGVCVQFNGENQNFNTTRPGRAHGLWILVDIKQSEYLFTQSRMAGVRVAVHERNETPSFNQKGILASPGQITSIGLKKKKTIDLPHPYTNCTAEVNTNECFQRCLENYVIGNCSCRKFYYLVTGKETCNPKQVYQCADPTETGFLEHNLAHECNCSEQCENIEYMYTISSAIGSESALTRIACNEETGTATCNTSQDITKRVAELRQSMVEIQVFFEDLKVEEVVMQNDYTELSLLCDIGGAFGLILGATVLTVFEFIDFFMVLIYECMKYRYSPGKAEATTFNSM